MKHSITKMCVSFIACFACAVSAQGKNIAVSVLDFKNLGGREYDFYQKGIAKTILSDMSCHPEISAVSPETRAGSFDEIALSQTGFTDRVIEPGKILATDFIINGTYHFEKNRARLIVTVIEVESGRVFESIKLDGTKEKFDETVDGVSFIILELLRNRGYTSKKLTEDDKNRVLRQHTNRSMAFRYYSMGLDFRHSNPVTARGFFQKAVSADGDYIHAILELALISITPFSEFEKAIALLDTAEKKLLSANDKFSAQYAGLLAIRGRACLGLSKFDIAEASFQGAMNVLRYLDRKDSFEYSEALNDLGTFYRAVGKYRESLDCLEKSLEIKKKLGMSGGIYSAITVNNISAVMHSLQKYDDALALCLRAKKIKEDLGLKNTVTFALSLAGEGSILVSMKKFSEGTSRLIEAMKIFKDRGLEQTRECASVYSNIGYALMKADNAGESLKNFLRAEKIYRDLGLHETVEYALLSGNLARLYFHHLKKPCESREWLRTAITIKRKTGIDVSGDDRALMDQTGTECGRKNK